jgi:Formiminotransferase-cyclodeaminase
MGRDFLSMPLEEYLDELARETRIPGAGPAAALTAAAAAALVAMAARYSRGSWEEATTTVAQAESLRRRATKLALEDAAALDDFLAARETPVDPRPEARDFHLGRTLARAADVPLAICETACDVALLARRAGGACGRSRRCAARARRHTRGGAPRRGQPRRGIRRRPRDACPPACGSRRRRGRASDRAGLKRRRPGVRRAFA